ncbi:MAG: hypothetical protein ACYC6T_18405 [Thermoleophilia bacterium]
MNAKWPVIVVVVAVVVGVAAFFGGMTYGQGRPPSVEAAVEAMRNASPEELAQAFQSGGGEVPGLGGGVPGAGGGFAGAGRQGGAMGGPGGGFVNGDIIASDAESITVKLGDGSSKIVFFSGSTSISRQAEGSASDLSEGTSVLVTGATNSDGSITAQTIQIRPAG